MCCMGTLREVGGVMLVMVDWVGWVAGWHDVGSGCRLLLFLYASFGSVWLCDTVFLGIGMNVLGWSKMGKRGIVFSGRWVLRLADCCAKIGHLAWSELAWSELVLHEMQWHSLGLGHEVMCSLAHVAQHLSLMHLLLMHLLLMWPYSWHLLHLVGSCMSLLVVTLVLKMKIHSVSSLLAALAVVHMTLMLVSFWLGPCVQVS